MGGVRSCITGLAVVLLCAAGTAVPAAAAQAQPEARTRVIVLTDIGNEPDDSESLVRFLVYANEFDVEGLIASTSTWQRDKVQPQLIRERLAAYAKVLPNLRVHAKGYPDVQQLENVVRSGTAAYGLAGVGAGKDSEASRLIIEAVDRPDPRPVWVTAWGGAVDLAQALWTVRATRSPEELARFVSKLRVYSISDQDDAGPWLRRTFPDLFWIASVHGWGQYALAAWTGISADVLRPAKWPAPDMVTNPWLEQHIRKGPLGEVYPPHKFIMEGDTPSFLYLIPNGLGVPEHPEFGGWGGRYMKSDLAAGHYGDAMDVFVDEDGQRYSGNQATIYRWRRTFQRDFEARMNWSVSATYAAANHNPELVVNGVAGRSPVTVKARAKDTVKLSAAGSSDPDGQALTYRWWQYAEPTGQNGLKPLAIQGGDTTDASVAVPEIANPATFHVILEVTDKGEPPLTSYRRVLIEAEPAQP